MYCKFCGKWVEGEGMVCESCAALRGEPGVPAAAPPSPAQPQAPAPAQKPAATQPAQKPAATQPAQKPAAAQPAQKPVPPAPQSAPPYYGYRRPEEDKPLNGVGIGGFVLAIFDLLPIWELGVRFSDMAEPLRSFLFFFLPMVIFQTIAIALSALGLRTRKQTRGGTFAVVGMLIAVVGLVMFVEMFIAGLIL